MVGTYHSIASLQQRIHDSAEICHTFGIVAEPRTTIDMNHHRITFSLHLRKVDVTIVERLTIVSIIHILKGFRSGKVHLRCLKYSKTTKSTSWLGIDHCCKRESSESRKDFLHDNNISCK